MSKIEIQVTLEKKLSISYQSVGLSASIKEIKQVDKREEVLEEMTALKFMLEQWLDEQIVHSAKTLVDLNRRV